MKLFGFFPPSSAGSGDSESARAEKTPDRWLGRADLLVSLAGLLAASVLLLGHSLLGQNFLEERPSEASAPKDAASREGTLRKGVSRETAPLVGTIRFQGRRMRITSETLWLARCLYSETKRPREQELVAWVVRGRVETAFRGQSTYQGAVLDPYQFSAFNPNRPYSRRFYSGLSLQDDWPGWHRALAIAWFVQHASPQHRPFPLETRHFYSPVSMPSGQPADWAVGRRPVRPLRPWKIDPLRFRFYRGVGPEE